MWRQLFLFFHSPFLMCRRVTATNEVVICNLGVLLGRKKQGEGEGKGLCDPSGFRKVGRLRLEAREEPRRKA